MSRIKHSTVMLNFPLALVLALPFGASASPLVTYTVSPDGFGDFQYNLAVDNTVSIFTIEGLIVVNGFSVFALDQSATIGTPSDWGDLPPIPPAVDNLSYFSMNAAGDIVPGQSLGGFSFVSPTDAGTLAPGDFAVELVATSGAIIPGEAVLTPEPGAMALAGLGLAVLLGCRWRRAIYRPVKTQGDVNPGLLTEYRSSQCLNSGRQR